MGATSVTGVSGPGSVGGKQKGSEHMSLGVAKLVGPKITAAGSVTLSGTTGTVTIPALTGAVTDYVVMLTANGATAPYVSTALAAVVGTGDWSFGVTAGSGAVVNWALVKTGLAGTYVPGG
jgi:hypothetical protein